MSFDAVEDADVIVGKVAIWADCGVVGIQRLKEPFGLHNSVGGEFVNDQRGESHLVDCALRAIEEVREGLSARSAVGANK